MSRITIHDILTYPILSCLPFHPLHTTYYYVNVFPGCTTLKVIQAAS